MARQDEQRADRAEDVAERGHNTAEKQGRRYCGARILDFISHETGGFASPKCEGQTGPENHALQVNSRNGACNRKRRCGAETVPSNHSQHNDMATGIPHGKRTHVVQPFGDAEPDDIQNRDNRKPKSEKEM